LQIINAQYSIFDQNTSVSLVLSTEFFYQTTQNIMVSLVCVLVLDWLNVSSTQDFMCVLIKNFDAMNATYQAQAMFKILHKDPPMPETLSPEGKDFLRRCFRRNPAERPSAMTLLEHPFVCRSGDLNVSAGTEAAPAVNLTVSIKLLFFNQWS
jgi:serine/threonine protein kinase